METRNAMKRVRLLAVMLVVASLALGACSGSDDSGAVETIAADEYVTTVAASSEEPAEGEAMALKAASGGIAIVGAPIGTGIPDDLKIIRDGRVEVRVDPGTFSQAGSQIRSVAADLGGYITAGETHLQEVDGVQYTVGWLTMRVPVDRFDDALERVDGLGERLSLSVSSQDVTEEYVDLEGRLRYWKTQEAFYARLMDEATDIEDLVVIQTRMQDVLLNIEQIEGRLRYLDSRTSFSTLTVGVTEVPDTAPIDVESVKAGMLGDAIEQAGTVLLATVGGLIVAGAFALPVLVLATIGFGLWRAVMATRRRESKDAGASEG